MTLCLATGEQKVQEHSHLEKGRMADTWSNLAQNNHKILQGRNCEGLPWHREMFLDQLWFYFIGGKYSSVLHAPVCSQGVLPYPLVFPETSNMHIEQLYFFSLDTSCWFKFGSPSLGA